MTPTPHRPQTSPPPARRVTTRPSCAPYASPLLFLLPAWGGFRLLLSLSVTVLRKASAYTRYIICCAPDYPPPLIEKKRSRLSSWAAHWLPAPLMTAAHTTSSFTSMFLPTFLEMAPIVGPLPLYASPARTPTTRTIYQKKSTGRPHKLCPRRLRLKVAPPPRHPHLTASRLPTRTVPVRTRRANILGGRAARRAFAHGAEDLKHQNQREYGRGLAPTGLY